MGDALQLTMKIHLTNFNNLNDVTYEIINNKVNFLFGLSGSGKSSISKSLNAIDYSDFLKVGSPMNSCSVIIENKAFDDGETVPIYDYDYMNRVLIEKDKQSDIYSIIYAGEDSLDIYKQQYNQYLGDLKSLREQLVLTNNNIVQLRSNLKIAFIKGGKEYKSTCCIRMFENTITSKGKNTLAHKYAGSRSQWFVEGAKTQEYHDGKCPFCSKKLNEKRKNIIESILSIDSKSFERITKQTPIFNTLNIETPQWNSKRSTNQFRKKILNLVTAEDEIESLIEIIDAAYATEFEINKIGPIKPKKQILALFPDLETVVSNFNNSLKEAKQTLGIIKSKTNKIISKNTKCINDYLIRFSIPYVFEKQAVDPNNKTMEYILRHIDDETATDRTDGLSFGEKNIIGLILFILINSNKKMMVLDDPASSFDNYRRKIILDLVFESKKPEATILILSHDEVFIKLALYFADRASKKAISKASMSSIEKKYSAEIGKTTFIEDNDNSDLIDICLDDFDELSCFIKNRLSELPRIINYQTAILIRLLCENITHKNKEEKNAYGYLSAIIHETPYPTIINTLSSVETSERNVLSVISNLRL